MALYDFCHAFNNTLDGYCFETLKPSLGGKWRFLIIFWKSITFYNGITHFDCVRSNEVNQGIHELPFCKRVPAGFTFQKNIKNKLTLFLTSLLFSSCVTISTLPVWYPLKLKQILYKPLKMWLSGALGSKIMTM